MSIETVSAVVVPVFEWLLTYAAHSTLLLGGAAAVTWWCADNHGWLARLWKTAMLGAMVTTSVQMSLEHEPLGGRWNVTIGRSTSASLAVRPAASARTVPEMSRPAAGVETRPDTSGDLAFADARSPRRPVAQSAISDSRTSANSSWLRERWTLLVVGTWLCLAALGLVRWALAHRRVRRGLLEGVADGTVPVGDTATAWAGSPFRLALSCTCDVPVALPGRTIVLPQRFAELHTDEQLAALAHEVAHVKRRDPEWLSLAVILERVFFFQPLHRLARRELSAAAEFLCDEWAVRQTGAPLALARCLATVAAWSSPTETTIGAVAIARHGSPLVRRVERILAEPHPTPRPSSAWLAAAIIVVAAGAPMFSARMPVVVKQAKTFSPQTSDKVLSTRPPTADEIATARQELRVARPQNQDAPLQERWAWALADANRRGLRDFWVVYSFSTPTHAEHVMMSDSLEGSIVIDGGKVFSKGPSLTDVLDGVSSAVAPGPVVVAIKYSSGRGEGDISRASYRSASLGFDFGRRPVFWLGAATETDSFRHLERLTSQVREEKLRILFIEAASLHPTTDLVLPFLVRLLDPSNPVAIRREAAEGFDHHHDPRSVEILLRTARQDPSEEVRSEAAETIGEIQTPEAIPALKELALGSPDSSVRREAAEAFSEQPAERAIPALESVINSSQDEGTLVEAVEALGDVKDRRALDLLVQIAWKHTTEQARREAVETLASIEGDESRAALVRIAWEHPDVAMQTEAVESLGDKDGSGAMAELERIVRDHRNEDVQAEAIETIGDVDKGVNDTLVQTARSGRNARVRREAIEALSQTASETTDSAVLDPIEQLFESIIFEDADHGVRIEAMDALDELPQTRARRVLRKVIDRHPDAQMREEATDHARERNH